MAEPPAKVAGRTKSSTAAAAAAAQLVVEALQAAAAQEAEVNEERRRLEERIEELEKSCEQHAADLNEATAETRAAKRQASHAEAAAVILLHRVHEKIEEHTALETENTEIKTKLLELEEKYKAQSSALIDAELAADSARIAVGNAEAAAGTTIAELEERLKTQTDALSKAEWAEKSAASTISNLQNMLRNQAAALTKAQAVADTERMVAGTATAKLKGLEQMYNAQTVALTTSLKTAAEADSKAGAAARAAETAASAKIGELELKCQELADALVKEETHSKAMEARVASAEAHARAAPPSADAAARIKELEDKVKAQTSALSAAKASRTLDANKAKTDLNELERQYKAKIEELSKAVSAAQAAKAMAESKLKKLQEKAQADVLTTTVAIGESAAAEIAELKQNLEKLEAVCQTQTEATRKSALAIVELEQTVATKERMYQEQAALLASSFAAEAAIKEENEKLKKRAEAAEKASQSHPDEGRRSALAAAETARIAELEKQVAELGKQLAKSEKMCQGAVKKAAAEMQKAEAAEALIDNKRNVFAGVQDSSTEQQQKIDELNEDLKNAKRQCAAATAVHEVLINENTRLTQEITNLQMIVDSCLPPVPADPMPEWTPSDDNATPFSALFTPLHHTADHSIAFSEAKARLSAKFKQVTDNARLTSRLTPIHLTKTMCYLCRKEVQGVQILYHFFSRTHSSKMCGASITLAAVDYWMAKMQEAICDESPLSPVSQLE